MKSRKRKRPNARPRIAAWDGEVIRVAACCALEIEIAFPRIHCRHDKHCPALHPSSVGFLGARAEANAAVADEITRRGIRTLAVMIS